MKLMKMQSRAEDSKIDCLGLLPGCHRSTVQAVQIGP